LKGGGGGKGGERKKEGGELFLNERNLKKKCLIVERE